MKLNELLNSKVRYEVIEDSSYTFATRAKIGDRYIVFYAGDQSGEGRWEIEFKEAKTDKLMGKSTFDLTGSGNELEVFAMVKDSIKELIATRKPEQIGFIADKADGSSRAQMYERLLKKFTPPGYEFERKDEDKHALFYMNKK